MNRDKSIRGVCVICKQEGVTNYHYNKAHGLVPRELFAYRSESKLWTCRKHGYASPDPHWMMMHFWRGHLHSHPSKLPYKTREPMVISPTLTDETSVSIKPSGVIAPPITAEAIVNAFEARVKTIDRDLEAKESTITAMEEASRSRRRVIDELNAELEAATSHIAHLEDEIHRANEQFGVVEDKTNSLIARLFKR